MSSANIILIPYYPTAMKICPGINVVLMVLDTMWYRCCWIQCSTHVAGYNMVLMLLDTIWYSCFCIQYGTHVAGYRYNVVLMLLDTMVLMLLDTI